MKLKDELKDWQIARIMFGKNTQAECKIVKKLRKYELEIAEMYSGIFLVIIKNDEIGWFITDEVISSIK